MIVFVVAYVAAIPFMNTSLIQGPIAAAWHGADIAYFVNLAGGGRALRGLSGGAHTRRVGLTRGDDEVVDQVHHLAGPLDVREMSDAGEDLEPASWPCFMHARSRARPE